MYKVLVLATSRKTRGGITSVVKAHEQGDQWRDYHCKWVATHRDGCFFLKMFYLLSGFLQFIVYLPFCKLLHVHFSEPPSAIRKRLFIKIATLLHKKIIVHFHSFSPETTIYGKHEKIYEYIFHAADIVIVLSEYWKKCVEEKFHLGEKLRVVYNPCTTEIYQTQFPKKKQILYAGTLNERKGYWDLIKAFSLIHGKYPEWRIVFAGNGEISKATERASSAGVLGQTNFLGWINGQEKDRVFKESMVFCLPSYAEGFSMAVLDAWAYGLPVITTPVGGIPDVAKDGENILLFSPGDVSSLSKCLDRLLSDKILTGNISRASLVLAERFSIDKINSQIGDLYSKLL